MRQCLYLLNFIKKNHLVTNNNHVRHTQNTVPIKSVHNNNGVNKLNTFKKNCPFYLHFKASEDGQCLFLQGMDKTHNHEVSKVSYKFISFFILSHIIQLFLHRLIFVFKFRF